MLRPVLVLAVLAVVGLGACSNENEPPDDYDPAVVRDGLAALFAGDHPETDVAEAGACFAEEFTAATTPTELREAGVLDSRFDVVAALPVLTVDLAAKWVDAQFACTDFIAESTRAQLMVTKGRLSPDAYAGCLRERMSEDDLRAAVTEGLTGDFEGEHLVLLTESQRDCAAESR